MPDISKEIREIADQIVERYRPEKIILFGSAARGEFYSDSDIDMLIIKKETPEYGIDRMRELRKLIKKKIAADFLIYRPDEIEKRLRMGDPFLRSVFDEGRVLYG